MPNQVTIDSRPGQSPPSCDPDPEPVKVSADPVVEWTCDDAPWAVVFGPDAPVHPKWALGDAGGKDRVTVMGGKRPEDPKKGIDAKRPVKYTVLVFKDGKVKAADPNLIIQP